MRFRHEGARLVPKGREARPHTVRRAHAGARAPVPPGSSLRFDVEQTSVPHVLELPTPQRLSKLLQRGCVVRLAGNGICISPSATDHHPDHGSIAEPETVDELESSRPRVNKRARRVGPKS